MARSRAGLAEMHAREMSHAYVLFRGDNAWYIKLCQFVGSLPARQLYCTPTALNFSVNPRASPSRGDLYLPLRFIYKLSVLDVWPVFHGGVVCPFISTNRYITSLTTCQPTPNLAYVED